MTSRRLRLGLPWATIAALLAIPASAVAAPYVPPGNSAATQYTEALPTAGGPKAADGSKGGKGKTPSRVLGHHNASRLDSQGPEGRAAAEVAAATAPPQVGGGEPASAPSQGGGSPGQATGEGGAPSSGHRDTGGGSNGGGSSAGSTTLTAKSSSPQPQGSSGSSGLGEVVGQATGASSSNPLGLLLPLLIVAVLIWSAAYFLRQRKHPTG